MGRNRGRHKGEPRQNLAHALEVLDAVPGWVQQAVEHRKEARLESCEELWLFLARVEHGKDALERVHRGHRRLIVVLIALINVPNECLAQLTDKLIGEREDLVSEALDNGLESADEIVHRDLSHKAHELDENRLEQTKEYMSKQKKTTNGSKQKKYEERTWRIGSMTAAHAFDLIRLRRDAAAVAWTGKSGSRRHLSTSCTALCRTASLANLTQQYCCIIQQTRARMKPKGDANSGKTYTVITDSIASRNTLRSFTTICSAPSVARTDSLRAATGGDDFDTVEDVRGSESNCEHDSRKM